MATRSLPRPSALLPLRIACSTSAPSPGLSTSMKRPWDSIPISSPRPRGLGPRAFCLSTSSVARARSVPSSRSPIGRGWHLIEDACEALGSSTDGRPAGSFGDVSVFAFYPNKQITTGEGGVVVTDDPELASTFRSLRNQGRDDSGTWLRHVRLGYNYRLDELSAAVGVAQLERIEELRAGRARVVSAYRAALERFEWLQVPESGPGEVVDWFVYVVRLAPWIDRTRLIEDLTRSASRRDRISARSICNRSTARRSDSEAASFR